ncbi:unnamed protein product, partial [Iphiclides podalirius]
MGRRVAIHRADVLAARRLERDWGTAAPSRLGQVMPPLANPPPAYHPSDVADDTHYKVDPSNKRNYA